MDYMEMLEAERERRWKEEVELYEEELKHFEEMLLSNDFPRNMRVRMVD